MLNVQPNAAQTSCRGFLPKSLRTRGLFLIVLPMVWQLGLLLGMSLLYWFSEQSAREDVQAVHQDDGYGQWNNARTIICDRLLTSALTGKELDRAECTRQLQLLDKYVSELRPVIGDRTYHNLLLAQADMRVKYEGASKNLALAALPSATPAQREAALAQAKAIARDITEKTTVLAEYHRDTAMWKIVAFTDREDRQEWIKRLASAVVLNLLLMLLLAWFFNRNVIYRLFTIRQNSMLLSKGEPLRPPIKGSDEIAQVDRSFHQMARALAEASKIQNALIANSADIICSLTEDGRFLAVSDASQNMLFLRPPELLGTSLFDLVSPEDQPHIVEQLHGIRSSGQGVFEAALRRSDGQYLDTVWTVSWSNQDASMFCVVHDNSVAKNIERLQQAVVQMVSHDLRSPLAVIGGFYEMLSAGMLGELSPHGQQLLVAAEDNSARMFSLTENLLGLARLEAGKLELNCEQLGCYTLFNDVLQAVEPPAQKNGVTINSVPSSASVYADGQRLAQVLINLLTHAIEFTPNGDSVTLSCDIADERSRIVIRHPAPGITAAEVTELFDRQKQGGTAGKGLGLAISKALVELHRGSILITGSDTDILYTVELPPQPSVTVSVAMPELSEERA